MARVVFLGTPEFGVPVLEALSEQHEVLAVVTQPDRRVGRGRAHTHASPVKEAAVARGLKVLQPVRLRRDREVLEELRRLQAEVFVLAAFGQILPQEVLDIPPHGTIGVHASLLPRLRGAAPITAAILTGEQETGITLMLTDAGMDTGAIIAQRSLPITSDDTTASLSEKLAHLGAELLIETLPAWLAGEITPIPQDDSQATYAPPINKEQGAIDWGRSASEIDRQIRAFTPWPGAFTTFEGRNLKVLRAHAGPEPATPAAGQAAPGTVVKLDEGIGVVTGEGMLVLETVQLAGKGPLDAGTFARGQRQFVGSVLG